MSNLRYFFNPFVNLFAVSHPIPKTLVKDRTRLFSCVASSPNLHFPRRPSKFLIMSGSGVAFTFFLLLFLAMEVVRIDASSNFTPVNGSVAEFLPVLEAGETGIMMMMNESRRRLRSFQICALCTCCGGARGLCLAAPCCYAINCHIPNRPFGFCAFTPKTCNCFGCHL